jgi:hypothetical protein
MRRSECATRPAFRSFFFRTDTSTTIDLRPAGDSVGKLSRIIGAAAWSKAVDRQINISRLDISKLRRFVQSRPTWQGFKSGSPATFIDEVLWPARGPRPNPTLPTSASARHDLPTLAIRCLENFDRFSNLFSHAPIPCFVLAALVREVRAIVAKALRYLQLWVGAIA